MREIDVGELVHEAGQMPVLRGRSVVVRSGCGGFGVNPQSAAIVKRHEYGRPRAGWSVAHASVRGAGHEAVDPGRMGRGLFGFRSSGAGRNARRGVGEARGVFAWSAAAQEPVRRNPGRPFVKEI